MREEIDGIILDVDGTLWDSTPIVADSWNRAARECGLSDYAVTPDTLKGLFGKTMAVIAENMFPDEKPGRRQEIMELCCRYEQEALEQDECKICYPGVVETIRQLAQKAPVFIVSNCQSGYIELFLEKTGLGPCVTDLECFGNNGRTKGENIRLVAERNCLNHPVYVGDTQGDCDAACEAGVPFIHAEYGFGRADRCDAAVREFPQLLPLLFPGD